VQKYVRVLVHAATAAERLTDLLRAAGLVVECLGCRLSEPQPCLEL